MKPGLLSPCFPLTSTVEFRQWYAAGLADVLARLRRGEKRRAAELLRNVLNSWKISNDCGITADMAPTEYKPAD